MNETIGLPDAPWAGRLVAFCVHWHGGQNSQMYKVASTGRFTSAWELRDELNDLVRDIDTSYFDEAHELISYIIPKFSLVYDGEIAVEQRRELDLFAAK